MQHTIESSFKCVSQSSALVTSLVQGTNHLQVPSDSYIAAPYADAAASRGLLILSGELMCKEPVHCIGCECVCVRACVRLCVLSQFLFVVCF